MRFERNVEVILVCRDYSLGKFTACRLKRKFKWRVKYASYLPLIEVAQKSAIFKPRSISPFARWSNETLVADANCRLFLASVIEKSINNGVLTRVNVAILPEESTESWQETCPQPLLATISVQDENAAEIFDTTVRPLTGTGWLEVGICHWNPRLAQKGCYIILMNGCQTFRRDHLILHRHRLHLLPMCPDERIIISGSVWVLQLICLTFVDQRRTRRKEIH
jgi:hypothetical protein